MVAHHFSAAHLPPSPGAPEPTPTVRPSQRVPLQPLAGGCNKRRGGSRANAGGGGAQQQQKVVAHSLLEHGFRARKKGVVARSLCGEFESQNAASCSPLWRSNRSKAVHRTPLPPAAHTSAQQGQLGQQQQQHGQQQQQQGHHHEQRAGRGAPPSAQKGSRMSAFQQGHIAASQDMHVEVGSARKPTPMPAPHHHLAPGSGTALRTRRRSELLDLMCTDMASVLSFDGRLDCSLEDASMDCEAALAPSSNGLTGFPSFPL